MIFENNGFELEVEAENTGKATEKVVGGTDEKPYGYSEVEDYGYTGSQYNNDRDVQHTTKFADGTMIETGTYYNTADLNGTSVTITYRETFIEEPFCLVSKCNSTAMYLVETSANASDFDVDINGTTDVYFTYYAIGRWKT